MTDLDGLESAAEGLVEGPLHQPLEPPLEPLESHAESVPSSPRNEAARAARRTSRGSRTFWGSTPRCSGDGRSGYPVALRASGGIGRRAGFRCLCPQGRGGSSPPSPTGRSHADFALGVAAPGSRSISPVSRAERRAQAQSPPHTYVSDVRGVGEKVHNGGSSPTILLGATPRFHRIGCPDPSGMQGRTGTHWNHGTRTHPPSFYCRRSLSPRATAPLPSGRHRGSSTKPHRTGQRGSRPAVSRRHRPAPAADQGRRGPPRPGHRGRQGRTRDPRHRRQGPHPRREARPRSGSSARARTPSASSSSRTCGWSCRSPSATRRRACRSSTWSRRATSASSTRSRSSTGARASSSRRTRRGGSARRSSAASPTRAAPSACPSTPPTTSPGSRRSAPGSRRASAVRRRSTSSRPSSTSLPSGSRSSSRTSREPVSLETPVGEDGETELGDLVEDRGAESPYESAARAMLPGRDREAAGRARRA